VINPKWTADRIKLLTDEWLRGTKGEVIGRKLGITKDAVLGKRRRLGLPQRQHRSKRNGY
jgi:GcrA cell cycle regulator